MGPASCRSAFEPKSILVCNWLLFFGAVTSKRFLLQERHPPTHLCTWAAGRCTKMGIAGFALIQQCGSAAGNFPNLSGSAGALTIHHHHVFKLPVVRRCFGKDKGKRPGHCPSPHPAGGGGHKPMPCTTCKQRQLYSEDLEC